MHDISNKFQTLDMLFMMAYPEIIEHYDCIGSVELLQLARTSICSFVITPEKITKL